MQGSRFSVEDLRFLVLKLKVLVFDRHHHVRQAPLVRFSKGQVCQESWDSFFQKKKKKNIMISHGCKV